MKFLETPLTGLYVVELEALRDERGYFARSFCVHEFAAHGIKFAVAQCNISYNEKKGTLRGLHFQLPPYEEGKLVACTSGAIYDVAVDIRPESSSYLRWFSIELTAENKKMLYIPPGFAHGFQTLSNNTVVYYMMSEFYHGESGRGVRWDDPALGITWPLGDPIMSDKDRRHPLLEDENK